MNPPTYSPPAPTGTASAPRHVRPITRGGNFAASLLFMLLGIPALFFTHWVIGGALIALGLLCDPKRGHAYTCGACGNEVAPTSLLCPCCHTRLIAQPPPSANRLLRITIALLLLAGAVLSYKLNMNLVK